MARIRIRIFLADPDPDPGSGSGSGSRALIKIVKVKFSKKNSGIRKFSTFFHKTQKLTKMLRKWAFFSMNLKKEKSTRQKTCKIVSEIGIFSQDPDPDPDPHFLRIRIRIRTGQKQADPGGSGSGSGSGSETLTDRPSM